MWRAGGNEKEIKEPFRDKRSPRSARRRERGILVSFLTLGRYTGALGEIALEYVLILFITSHSKQCSPESGSRRISFPYFTCLAVPSMWLMSMYSVLEDFTGKLICFSLALKCHDMRS